jgi:SAM-dependent methyltransferase
MYGGLDKLGPGDDHSTRLMLGKLPRHHFRCVVDVGCGSGRQTLVLARELDVVVHAVDNFAPFLDELNEKAATAGLSDRVRTLCLDMAALDEEFADIDLLWGEGSAYNLGFATALQRWFPVVAPGGCVVLSELSWLNDGTGGVVREFWDVAYPGMGTIEENCRAAVGAGYRLLDTHTLPRQSWEQGYYDILRPRAESLLDHEDSAVRALARENLEEIEIFQLSGDSYGYVFYLLQRD